MNKFALGCNGCRSVEFDPSHACIELLHIVVVGLSYQMVKRKICKQTNMT